MPIFRPAAALYAIAAPVVRQAELFTLGTFHERQGDQWLLEPPREPSPGDDANVFDGSLPLTLWGRIFGDDVKHDGSGQLQAEFSGHFLAAQIGLDLAKLQTVSGETDHLGLFYAYSAVAATGHGFVVDTPFGLAGHVSLSSHTVGGYWTHIGRDGWYADGVLMGSFYNYTPTSTADAVTDLTGSSFTGSLEAGYPWRLSDTIELETQGQLIVQTIGFDKASDPFTTLAFSSDASLTGRFGLQLQDNLDSDGNWVQPRILVNLWHTFGGRDTTVYNGVIPIGLPYDESVIEVGGGVAAKVDDHVSTYAQFSYSTNIGGQYIRRFGGMIGIRVTP